MNIQLNLDNINNLNNDSGCWINKRDINGFGYGGYGGGGFFDRIGGVGCGFNHNGGGTGLVIAKVGNNGIGCGNTSNNNTDSGGGK